MELPLYKGNWEVGESQSPRAGGSAPLTFLWRTGLHLPDDKLSPVREGMGDGFLGAKNWPSGIQWYPSRNFFGLHGTPIGDNDLQMSWLASSRCPDCRLILAPY